MLIAIVVGKGVTNNDQQVVRRTGTLDQHPGAVAEHSAQAGEPTGFQTPETSLRRSVVSFVESLDAQVLHVAPAPGLKAIRRNTITHIGQRYGQRVR
jgi:hypothetical protein